MAEFLVCCYLVALLLAVKLGWALTVAGAIALLAWPAWRRGRES